MADPRESLDEQLQLSAEAGDAGLPEAARYARLFAALRDIESPRPPSNFAVLTAEAAQGHAQDRLDRIEGIGVRIALAMLVVLAFGAPLGLAWLFREQLVRLLPGAPWPMMLATASGLIALAVFDRRAQADAGRRARK